MTENSNNIIKRKSVCRLFLVFFLNNLVREFFFESLGNILLKFGNILLKFIFTLSNFVSLFDIQKILIGIVKCQKNYPYTAARRGFIQTPQWGILTSQIHFQPLLPKTHLPIEGVIIPPKWGSHPKVNPQLGVITSQR